MERSDIASRLDPQMAAARAKQAELAPGLGDWHGRPLEEVRAHYVRDRV